MSSDKNYINYFQSVITIGVITSGKNKQEAQEKSKGMFGKEDVSFGLVNQTPFEISDTELWEPDFIGCIDNGNISFCLNEKIKQKISNAIGKENITDKAYLDFVKASVEKALN